MSLLSLCICVSSNISIHNIMPCLRSNLRLLHISMPCHLIRLLDCVDAKNLKVSVFLQRFFIGGHFQAICDRAHLLGAVQGSVMNLGLEWKSFDLSHIDIDHLEELTDWLHLVFESNVSVCIHVTKVFSKYSLVCTNILR